jgi:calcium/calmodulin-dependent protein kinase-4
MSEFITYDRKRILFKEKYTVGEVLGVGVSGTVHAAYKRATSDAFALKEIKKGREVDESALLREIELMSTLQSNTRHPSVIALEEVFETDTEFYILMERAFGGELFERIQKLGKYTEDDAREVACALLSAVAALHEHGIVHRDIKPENILLANSLSHTQIKIVDFGLSCRSPPPAASRAELLFEPPGTLAYAAPEVRPEPLTPPRHATQCPARPFPCTHCPARPNPLQTLDGSGYGTGCDVWGVGVVLYVLLSGALPFPEGQGCLDWGRGKAQGKGKGRPRALQFPERRWKVRDPSHSTGGERPESLNRRVRDPSHSTGG